MRLIHLTDPHLTPLTGIFPRGIKGALSWLSWQTKRRHQHRRERLDRLVHAVRETWSPDLWAVTGDLCQTGRAREIEQARDWLQTLGPPQDTLLVPGNHDIFDRHSAALVQRHWREFLHNSGEASWPVVIRKGNVSLIALNSAVVTPPGSAQGELGDAQRERLDRILGEESGQCRIVMIHHPPDPGACKARKALRDAQKLTDVLRRHQPAVVLHGHVHRNRNAALGDTTVLGTASASAGGALGDACARRIDIRSDADGFILDMELLALDANESLHTVDSRQWQSRG